MRRDLVNATASELGVRGDVRIAVTAIRDGYLEATVSIRPRGPFGVPLPFACSRKRLISIIETAAGLYELKRKLAGKGEVIGIGDGTAMRATTDTGQEFPEGYAIQASR